MKIVLDTNVVVSGFLSPQGVPARILRFVIEGNLTLCVDPRIVAEYREVLVRPEFALPPGDVAEVIEALLDEALFVNALPADIKTPDTDDQMFVETAISAGADAIVTGNKRHFPAGKLKNIIILSPAELLERMKCNGYN